LATFRRIRSLDPNKPKARENFFFKKKKTMRDRIRRLALLVGGWRRTAVGGAPMSGGGMAVGRVRKEGKIWGKSFGEEKVFLKMKMFWGKE
jgi:hypothetical protein